MKHKEPSPLLPRYFIDLIFSCYAALRRMEEGSVSMGLPEDSETPRDSKSLLSHGANWFH